MSGIKTNEWDKNNGIKINEWWNKRNEWNRQME